MIDLYLTRHAQKKQGDFYNRLYKYHDNPISNIGITQSILLADYLPGNIENVFCSKMIRTVQTISPYTKRKSINIIEDGRINEIRMGVMAYMEKGKI